MNKYKIYLSLGSNAGERHAILNAALKHLRAFGSLQVSSEYVNAPQGFESTSDFVNLGAVLTVEQTAALTAADAIRLLDCFQNIERELSAMPHRNSDGSYRDREIDIDIVAIEGLKVESERLTLPHPRAHERDFVKIPLRELGVDIDALLK